MLIGGMGAEAVHAYLQHNLVPYALRLPRSDSGQGGKFLNPDDHRAGGFTAMLEIAHLAAAYDVRIGPYLVPGLSVSVLVSIPNAALVEVLAGSPSNLWREPVEIVGGHMTPPNRPQISQSATQRTFGLAVFSAFKRFCFRRFMSSAR